VTAMVPRRSVPAIVAVLAGCSLAALRMRQQMSYRRPALPPPQPQWLSLDQAAKYTGLSEGFLQRLIKARRLAVMPDDVPKIRRADLDRLGDLGSAVGELRQAMKGRRG
jgi:excisionase family DNA binding protein